jgi:hypothetical protein
MTLGPSVLTLPCLLPASMLVVDAIFISCTDNPYFL